MKGVGRRVENQPGRRPRRGRPLRVYDAERRIWCVQHASWYKLGVSNTTATSWAGGGSILPKPENRKLKSSPKLTPNELRVQGCKSAGCRVQGVGCRVQNHSGLGFRVWGVATRSPPETRKDSAAASVNDLLDYWCQLLVFGFRVSDFGFRVSGFGLGVSCFGFWVSGSGFRVSGLGFPVSGFGSINPVPARDKFRVES